MRTRPAIGVIAAGVVVGLGVGLLLDLWSASRPIVLSIAGRPDVAAGPDVRGLQIRSAGGGGGSGPIDEQSPMGLPSLQFMSLTLGRDRGLLTLDLEFRNSRFDAMDVIYRVEDDLRLIASQKERLVRAGHHETRTYRWVPSDDRLHTLTVTTTNRDFAETQQSYITPLTDRNAAPSKRDWLLLFSCAFFGGVLAAIGRALVIARRRGEASTIESLASS
jgi:hypothetical protein